MDVPETVQTAIGDRPVDGAVCLEAGAGAGNMTGALLEGGATEVVSVTNDPDHAATVRDRFFDSNRLSVVEGDLQEIPLPDESVDLLTAHALFNVVTPASRTRILAELTRIARPGAHLVVDDYAPIPPSAPIRRLFAVENAAAELADHEPVLSFYPAEGLQRHCAGLGWRFDRKATLLDPVPWTEELVDAHADIVRETLESLPADVRDALLGEVDRSADVARDTAAGEMYSIAFRLPS